MVANCPTALACRKLFKNLEFVHSPMFGGMAIVK